MARTHALEPLALCSLLRGLTKRTERADAVVAVQRLSAEERVVSRTVGHSPWLLLERGAYDKTYSRFSPASIAIVRGLVSANAPSWTV